MKAEIINRIIKETKATSYLEIGYGQGENFDKIECEVKLAIDPEVKPIRKLQGIVYKKNSDDFFSENEDDIDVVFIDGSHISDDVRKDITNALKCNPKAIILHDTIPKTKAMAAVPRKQKEWTGDVYLAAVGFHKKYPDVKFETYRADYGLTVIYPEGKKVKAHFEKIDLSYEDFKKDEVSLLNIID